MNYQEQIGLVIGVIILAPVLGGILGLPFAIISKITEFGTSMLGNIVTSNVAGNLVQNVTGNTLKTIVFRFSIGMIPVSISAFFAAKFLIARSMR